MTQALIIACLKGEMEKVQNLIEQGADINFINSTGKTPLLAACIKNHIELVEFLLKNNVTFDINFVEVNKNQLITSIKKLLTDKLLEDNNASTEQVHELMGYIDFNTAEVVDQEAVEIFKLDTNVVGESNDNIIDVN